MTRYPWFFIIPCVAIIAIVAVSLIRFHLRKLQHKKKDKAALIAHTNFVRNLPEYKKAQKRYNLMLIILAVAFVVAVGSLSIVASRPISVTETKTEAENRDIMLCLDVSGSMYGNLKNLLNYYIELVSEMEGERFGITIFDGIYVTLSPLSTDYAAITEILNDLKGNFKSFRDGMKMSQFSSSEIGPGLVGCISAFDNLGEMERSRSIVLATDNMATTGQAVTLMQAANYAKSYNIAVYGLNTTDSRAQELIDAAGGYESDFTKEFREAALATGGSYYSFNDGINLSAKRIVDQILEQETARYEGAGKVVRTDTPDIAMFIAAISLSISILISWRLRI